MLMPNYADWNEAILEYVLEGLRLGSRVFLAIDDEALIGAGEFLSSAPLQRDRPTDFLRAVRDRCVLGSRVVFSRVRPDDESLNATPPYVSFLAATVLAAYRMGEEEDVSPNNYFVRLNEVLGLKSVAQGRPPGLDAGAEEELWLHWSEWLNRRGFLASAKRGSGPTKYVNYPISQTLLRDTDKDSLWHHFTERDWSKKLDEDAVIARIIRDRRWITRHLERLLSDESLDSARREGLFEAIYELYELWSLSEPESEYSSRSATFRREISAGLYRTVDPFSGQRHYRVLPRQPRRVRVHKGKVRYEGYEERLIPERPGWFRPLWEVGAQELTSGFRVSLDAVSQLETMKFPAREFWILTPDPENPDSGVYASWSRLSLGTPFVLLCQRHLVEQLDYLKSEELINWRTGDPISVWKDEEWLEYRDVQVISEGWKGLSLENENLLRSLQPSHSLGISFRGGLRIPQLRGWLSGYPPEVVVHSFYGEARLEIVEPLTGDIAVESEYIPTNQPHTIELPSISGTYLLTVESGSDTKETPINIINWTDLEMPEIEERGIEIGEGTVFGALVRRRG